LSQGYAKAFLQGATGVQGPIGYTGPQGATGAIGPTGPTTTPFYTGQATLDFGSSPGSNLTTVIVTGQSDILSTSTIKCFMMADTTDSPPGSGHNSFEHSIAPIQLTAGSIIPGTGFTITGISTWHLTSTFIVRWQWS
jgi:hypothetical protein